ncbi:outer membrane lipoprotein-sorting protein [Cupriavidus agavae]|uniref:ABC-type lipoprotein release transport system permease subunit n=1 Tax=Cupriavidus agavae TaxID=1001822 RepID=A0A4Q7RZI2_9BURK|nr:outer membrane lipoprotein-sorting protein [Cupriavidus agavae]RZT38618.1 ABC-type lipoprotein release transport system permease subunit [Cupriavidus agavae]
MLKLALNNLRRDRRRTVATMVALTSGLVAVLLFLAYMSFVEASMARVVIHAQGNGHVQVYRTGGQANLAAFPARYALDAADQARIRELVATVPGVRRAGADMTGVGMVQLDNRSTVFLASGIDPEFEAALRGEDGEAVAAPKDLASIRITPHMADRIGASAGDVVQLAATSYAQRANAMDAEVRDTSYSTGIEAIESKGLRMPLADMQSLYDTEAVSRMIVQVDDRADTDRVAAHLTQALEAAKPGRFDVTTWRSPHVGQLYNSFMGFFNMLFAFAGVVIALVAVATVQHTVAMNIEDRMKEVATLRAIGYPRARIVAMFVIETAVTALAVALLAVLLAWAVRAGIAAAGVTTSLPRVAQRVPLVLQLTAVETFTVVVGACVLIVLSSALTTWRRLRRSVRFGGQRSHSLSRVLAGGVAALAGFVWFPVPPAAAADAMPDVETMRQWLKQADMARGGFANLSWDVAVHSEDPAGNTDTEYAVQVRDGDALIRTTAPRRYQGERILIASHAMWYTKPGLRRPISVSPQQRLVGEAANGDIAATQYARDYVPEYGGVVSVDGRDCHKLVLKATHKAVTYAGIVYYLETSTLLGIKADFMTAAGDVFKTAAFEYGNTVIHAGKRHPFVSSMTIANAAFPDRFSRLVYRDVTAASHPATAFSRDQLTSM